jgi:hypothetical protein
MNRAFLRHRTRPKSHQTLAISEVCRLPAIMASVLCHEVAV